MYPKSKKIKIDEVQRWHDFKKCTSSHQTLLKCTYWIFNEDRCFPNYRQLLGVI